VAQQDNAPWVERFTGLSRLDDETKALLIANSRVIDLPAGAVIFGPGKTPENMLFLLSGTVRVQQMSDAGREIVLYRINAGESCVMTTACLLAQDSYMAEGVAETKVQAAALPRDVFDDLLGQSKPFRQFVFAAFSRRITDLFTMIEAVAFQRMDARIAGKLLMLAGAGDTVQTTHQKLSVELGTAREVVSRQLQDFQKRGWIEQTRGNIHILDAESLSMLAEKDA